MVVLRPPRVNDVIDVSDGKEADEVGGWLLLLCLLLLVGKPVSLAFGAAQSLGALPTRGPSLAAVVLCQLLIAGVGVAAGLALLGRRQGAVSLARWSLVLSAVMDQFVYATPFLPNNRLPGTTLWFAAASLAFYTIWIEYLLRSKRVRRTFPPA